MGIIGDPDDLPEKSVDDMLSADTIQRLHMAYGAMSLTRVDLYEIDDDFFDHAAYALRAMGMKIRDGWPARKFATAYYMGKSGRKSFHRVHFLNTEGMSVFGGVLMSITRHNEFEGVLCLDLSSIRMMRILGELAPEDKKLFVMDKSIALEIDPVCTAIGCTMPDSKSPLRKLPSDTLKNVFSLLDRCHSDFYCLEWRHPMVKQMLYDKSYKYGSTTAQYSLYEALEVFQQLAYEIGAPVTVSRGKYEVLSVGSLSPNKSVHRVRFLGDYGHGFGGLAIVERSGIRQFKMQILTDLSSMIILRDCGPIMHPREVRMFMTNKQAVFIADPFCALLYAKRSKSKPPVSRLDKNMLRMVFAFLDYSVKAKQVDRELYEAF